MVAIGGDVGHWTGLGGGTRWWFMMMMMRMMVWEVGMVYTVYVQRVCCCMALYLL